MAGRAVPDDRIAAALTAEGHRSPMRDHLLPSTVKGIRLRHKLMQKRSQSHPRSIPVTLTVPQLADRLQIGCHWIYDRIHNGTIAVSRDPATRLYLFPDTPDTTRLTARQLWAGEIQNLQFPTRRVVEEVPTWMIEEGADVDIEHMAHLLRHQGFVQGSQCGCAPAGSRG